VIDASGVDVSWNEALAGQIALDELGVTPSPNVGDVLAVFEAVYGT
jgi:hypothetical protein